MIKPHVPLVALACLMLSSVVLVPFAAGQLGAAPAVPSRAADAAPEGLSATEWIGIRSAYEAGKHSFEPIAEGHAARNPGQQWRTTFDGRGFLAQPDHGQWQWGLELTGYGFAGHERRIGSGDKAGMKAEAQRLTYAWDATIEEWFVNDPHGLEHGFTVKDRPAGAPPLNAQPSTLNFVLAVRGGLRPEVQTDGRGVRFVDAQGAAALTYSELTVLDADGRKLPARFESATGGASVLASRDCLVETRLVRSLAPPENSEAIPPYLRLVIDERGARYPLTIDPIAQQAYLKASNGGSGRWGGVEFGSSAAISGDTVVVGADMESSDATGVDGDQSNDNAQWAGAAYVFVRSGNTWTQQAYLKASNTGASDNFGSPVAISGDTVVVGVRNEDSNATGINGDQGNNGAADSGAAYVFVRNGTTWTQQAYLKASNAGPGDFFGMSVGVSGDTVVVGAYNEDSNATGVNGDQANNTAANSGAAYVFVRNGTTWSQQAYLKASNTGANDQFSGVKVSGDTVVIGAGGEDSNATGVNGDQGDNSAIDSGAAYVFVRNGTNWSQQAYLKASNTEANDYFGGVAVSGDTVVVGATGEDSNATGVNGDQGDNSATGSGAAYVFVRNGSTWSQQAYLKASNTGGAAPGDYGDGDHFGNSVAISGDTMVIGTGGEDSNATGVDGDGSDNSAMNSGAAYVFVRNGTTWTQQAYLKASNTDGAISGHVYGDGFGGSVGIFGGSVGLFGASVGISGDTVLIGAWREASNATGVDGDQSDNSALVSGAAYVFTGFGIPTSVPAVKASRSGDLLVISWPASTNDFQLESTTSVGTGSVWENVATPPVVIGDEQVVTIDIGPGAQFFRLKKP